MNRNEWIRQQLVQPDACGQNGLVTSGDWQRLANDLLWTSAQRQADLLSEKDAHDDVYVEPFPGYGRHWAASMLHEAMFPPSGWPIDSPKYGRPDYD